MKTFLFCTVLAAIPSIFLMLPAGNATERAPLFLKLGEQRVLPLPPFDRYSVSGSAIRYTRISRENRLLIKGVAVGTSTLLLTRGAATSTQLLRVEAKVESPYPKGLFQSLNLLENLEAIDGGNQFILRGMVNCLSQARAIALLKRQYPLWITDETELDPEWFRPTVRQLAEALKPYPHLQLLVHENAVGIQGVVANATALTGLIRKIQQIQPLATLDIQTTKSFSPTLYFKVFLLEVKKEFSSKLGLELSQPITGTISSIEQVAGNSVNYSIHALSQKGFLRILSAPELVVKSPGQAELFAGGEMPIRTKTHFQEQVSWKHVGLSLKLDVKEYNGDSVKLTIETELNHKDGTLSLNDIPGIKTNRIRTQVEGTMGKPLLLSGLLQEDTFEKVSGMPGLAGIPVLGALFGSDDFQKDRSELVAVLLPYREPPKEPMQRISSDIPKGFLPLSRNHLSQDEIEKLQASREYPWNVL